MRSTTRATLAVFTALFSTIAATPVEPDTFSFKELAARVTHDPAISFATWDDTRCSSGQVNYDSPDETCFSLPGNSMKIWWLEPGCSSTFPLFSFAVDDPPRSSARASARDRGN